MDFAPWDLDVVLEGLCSPLFEPLEQAEIKWLSIKTGFLLAITSAQRVGELHALSVSTQCMRCGPDNEQVTLWPNPGFLPNPAISVVPGSVSDYRQPSPGAMPGMRLAKLC